MSEKYVKLGDLLVYKLAIELSDTAWKIYLSLVWQDKKIMGDQFIESTDSFGANIAEGYGRFHYLDRIKFYYNARASLNEAKHWCFVLNRREKVSKDVFIKFLNQSEQANFQINRFIKTTYDSKDQGHSRQ